MTLETIFAMLVANSWTILLYLCLGLVAVVFVIGVCIALLIYVCKINVSDFESGSKLMNSITINCDVMSVFDTLVFILLSCVTTVSSSVIGKCLGFSIAVTSLICLMQTLGLI